MKIPFITSLICAIPWVALCQIDESLIWNNYMTQVGLGVNCFESKTDSIQVIHTRHFKNRTDTSVLFYENGFLVKNRIDPNCIQPEIVYKFRNDSIYKYAQVLGSEGKVQLDSLFTQLIGGVPDGELINYYWVHRTGLIDWLLPKEAYRYFKDSKIQKKYRKLIADVKEGKIQKSEDSEKLQLAFITTTQDTVKVITIRRVQNDHLEVSDLFIGRENKYHTISVFNSNGMIMSENIFKNGIQLNDTRYFRYVPESLRWRNLEIYQGDIKTNSIKRILYLQE